jgi:hypothetical protein
MAQPGRNESCPCGSGKKYKHCCALKQTGVGSSRLIMALIAGAILIALIAAASTSRESQPRGVWSAEHGHYHDASGREIPR